LIEEGDKKRSEVHEHPLRNFPDFGFLQINKLQKFFQILVFYIFLRVSKNFPKKNFEFCKRLFTFGGNPMLLLLSLLSCQDITLKETKTFDIIVAPETLDFGHLRSGHESDTKEITIFNPTAFQMVVDRLELDGRNYFVNDEGFVIDAGSYHQIEVSYTPATFEHNEGFIDIYLEGQDAPIRSVWLDGNGDAPVINLNPLTVDYGSPLVGCEPTQQIFIENNGNIDLVVNDISFMTNTPQEIHISYGSLGAFPWTVAAGAKIAFFMDYRPMDESNDFLTFEVHSNDPLVHVYGGSAEGSAIMSNEVTET